METETYITSQGEIVRKEAPKDGGIEEKKYIDKQESTGVLGELWHTVKDTTEAAAHMAEMAAVIAGEAAHSVKEVTVDLLGKAHDASDKIVEQTKEFVHMVIEEKPKIQEQAAAVIAEQKEAAVTKVEDAKAQVDETKSELVEKAKQLGSEAIEKVHQLQDIVDQGKAKIQSAVETATELGADALATAEKMWEQGKEAVPAVQQATEYVKEKGTEVVQTVKQAGAGVAEQVTATVAPTLPRVRSFKRSLSKQAANAESELGWNKGSLTLTMDVVSHIQRIADRTGDAVLHDTARRAHSACAKGLSEAPGVHLTWVTPQQANDLVNLAIRTQDHELADFARYCQSVAATSHIAVEPTPGKIQAEILKGYQELQQQGRIHVGPGYGAAFASVNKAYNPIDNEGPHAPPSSPVDDAAPQQRKGQPLKKQQPAVNEQGSISQQQPPALVLTMDVVSHIQRIADRTGNAVLHETARKAHSAFAKGASEAPGVHLTWITPQQASELMNLASRTGDAELVDFARYCQSVASTTQIGVEPSPGKIQEEIMKGRAELQQLSLQPATAAR